MYCVFEVGPLNCKGGASSLAVLIGAALQILARLNLVHNFQNPSNHHRPSAAADVANACFMLVGAA